MKINTDKLQTLLGSEAAVQRFVALFQAQLPAQIEALRSAIQNRDWETAANTAHALKSQCRYMGLDETAELLQQIEHAPEGTRSLDFLDDLGNVQI